MSTESKDIAYDVINKIYTALGGDSGFTSVSYTNIPLYKSIPQSAPEVYIRIGEVISTEDGTKDDFVFRGSVPVIVNDESLFTRVDKKKAQTILGEVRKKLKPTKASVPAGLVILRHGGFTEYVDMSEVKKPKVRLVDIYEFIIE